jgi:2,4-dienoyl-CoA reductase-like NADH-dependent reductase (Old Yellow Enzyme family)
MNSILFEQASIKNIRLKNRFVRSATMEGMATSDGLPTGALKDLYCMLADGGVGFIITSGAIIEPYKHFPENFSTALAIDENDKIEAWHPNCQEHLIEINVAILKVNDLTDPHSGNGQQAKEGVIGPGAQAC